MDPNINPQGFPPPPPLSSNPPAWEDPAPRFRAQGHHQGTLYICISSLLD